jgi:hypothetical protein
MRRDWRRARGRRRVASSHHGLVADGVLRMAVQSPEFHVTVQPRGNPAGTYTYRITRSDNPNWAEIGGDSYANPEAALAAGQVALERHQRANRR